MRRFDWGIGLIVAAAIAATSILYGLGAAYHKDSVAESHTLFHWAAGVAGGGVGLLVVVLFFWPAYRWAVEYRTRWVAELGGRPALRVPLVGHIRRRKAAGELVIVKALFGREGDVVDVTDIIRGLVKDGRLTMVASLVQLGVDDPLFGVVKELVVTYRVGSGRERIVSFTENFPVELP